MNKSKEYRRLVALAAEARRRGMSYGQLMGETTLYERQKIVSKSKGSRLPLDHPHHR